MNLPFQSLSRSSPCPFKRIVGQALSVSRRTYVSDWKGTSDSARRPRCREHQGRDILTDAQHAIVQANPAFCEITGYPLGLRYRTIYGLHSRQRTEQISLNSHAQQSI